MDKLNNLGLRAHKQNFWKSYLSKRQQLVYSRIVHPNFTEVAYGVPQGSVLGPLLFLVYINDIDDNCSQNCLTVYAEDAVVKQKGESTTEVFSQSLNLVSDYLKKKQNNYEPRKNLFFEHESQTEKFTATIKDDRNKPNTEIITEILSHRIG